MIPILYNYWQAKRRLRFSREKLDAWQKKHLENILHFARTHSPFYARMEGKVISKKEMMADFSSFNTKGIEKDEAYQLALKGEQTRDFQSQMGEITIGLSSGTSGNRGLFLVSKKERHAWCGNILARVLPKPLWKKQKIALFLRANSALYETVQSKRLNFAYFDLLEPIESLRKKVARFAPDVLVAPPSMLLLLKESCKPERIISVAETLFSKDQEELETAFGQKIYQIYQCTEGFLGFSCSYGTLHLNEDLLIIEKEYLDEKRFIPIITDLFRTTQPIIRYRLDDVLVEKKEACPCGCTFLGLERIEGRCDDVLYVKSLKGGQKPLFPDFISRQIIAASPEIEDYQVVQTQIDRWEVYLKPQFAASVAAALNELFKQLECTPPKLVFVDSPFPREAGAKLRRIRRTYAV